MKFKYISVVLLLLSFIQWGADCFGQKQIIDSLAYHNWKILSSPKISDNGKWVVYKYSYLLPEEQDKNPDFTLLYNTVTKSTTRLLGSQISFTNEGNWIRYEKNQEDGSSLKVLRNLKTGYEVIWDKPYYFQDDKNSSRVFYSYKPEQSYKGNRLVVYNYVTKDSLCYENLLQYQFSADKKSIIALQVNKDKINLKYWQSSGKVVAIYTADTDLINSFALNDHQNGGNFILKGKDSNGQLADRFLYEFDFSGKVAIKVDFDKIPQINGGFQMEKSCYVTNGGNFIFPYVNKTVNQGYHRSVAPKDDSGVDIWKWDEGAMDRRMAKLRGRSKQAFTPDFAYCIDQNKIIQLTKNPYERVVKSMNSNVRYVFVEDLSDYKVQTDWTFEEGRDIYIVDLQDGNRYLMEDSVYTSPVWSNNGKVSVKWNPDKLCWERIKYNKGKIEKINLTKNIPFAVHDEDYDLPLSVPPYGIAAWINDDQDVIFYDKYDMWMVNVEHPDKAVCITGNYGREHKIQLRFGFSLLNTSFQTLNDFALLRSINEETKSRGVYSFRNKKVTKLHEGDFTLFLKAVSGNGSAVLFTKETYQSTPDLFYADIRFKEVSRVSDLNPQTQKLAFGTNKMMRWKDGEGKNQEGVLFLPEDYDSTKVYPTIVYFYEVSSSDRFTFKYPNYAESSLNIPTYVSTGYVVFQPDIHFEVGKPSESSFKAVVSGTKYLVDKGIADPDRIGIHGHSFGAYQTANIITKTDMFTCAVPASVVTNLTSNYSGLRVNGIANMFMYESGQMRMGKSMFDDKQSYLDASTLLHADKIKTPVLIFHCDDDNAVPFEEGRALFFALRRLRKPAWLINYKGQAHDLHKLSSQKDWTYRLQSFFDYYLKDSDQPEWMK